MFLSSLIISLALFNLLLIPSRIFFILLMVCQLWNFKFSIFYIYHICPCHAHAFFNFLKLWSVFKISPLTSSCTNFTICVIYLSISLMVFPLIMDHIFFCMHACMVIFSGMPDIVNFILLWAGIFAILNVLRLCSGTPLTDWETFWFFYVLSIVGQSQNSL